MIPDFENNDFIMKAKEAIENSSMESSVYIGCDSLRYRHNGSWFAEYSIVIVLHIDSNRGGRIFHRTIKQPDFGNIKQRLIQEAIFAATVGTHLLDVIGTRKMVVHLDLNRDPKHFSNIAVNEAIGYVKGMGLEAVIKPHSFAASHVGDHVVRGKNVGW